MLRSTVLRLPLQLVFATLSHIWPLFSIYCLGITGSWKKFNWCRLYLIYLKIEISMDWTENRGEKRKKSWLKISSNVFDTSHDNLIKIIDFCFLTVLIEIKETFFIKNFFLKWNIHSFHNFEEILNFYVESGMSF